MSRMRSEDDELERFYDTQLETAVHAAATMSREIADYSTIRLRVTIDVHEAQAAKILQTMATPEQVNVMTDVDVAGVVTQYWQRRADEDPVEADLAPYVDRVRAMSDIEQPAALSWPVPPGEQQ